MPGIELGTVRSRAVFDVTDFKVGVDQAISQLRRLQSASAGMGTAAAQGMGGVSEAYKRVQAQLSGVNEQAKEAGTAVKQAGADGAKGLKDIEMASLKAVYVLRQISSIAEQWGQRLAIAGQQGLRAVASIVTTGASLNQMLVTIRNNTMLTDAEFVEMAAVTKRLGMELGANMEQVAMGIRHIADYGYRGKAAFDMVTAAAKAGVATGTDVGETAQLLSRVMRVFNLDVGKSAQVMNALWYAAANSNLMMKNLVEGGARAIAMAGPLGLRFEETAAILSVFAHQGLNISQAATQFINDLNKLGRPTKQTADYLDWLATKSGPDLRKNFNITAIASRGVVQAFEAIAEKSRATGIPLAELATHLFPNLRGVTGALIGTTTEGLTGLRKSLGDIGDLMEGKTDPITARYNDSAKQLGVQLDKLKNSFTVLASEIASTVVPALKPLIDSAADAVKWFRDLPKWVQNTTLVLAALGAGGLLVAGQLLKVVAALVQIREAMMLLAAAGGIKGALATAGIGGGTAAAAGLLTGGAAIAGGLALGGFAALQQGRQSVADIRAAQQATLEAMRHPGQTPGRWLLGQAAPGFTKISAGGAVPGEPLIVDAAGNVLNPQTAGMRGPAAITRVKSREQAEAERQAARNRREAQIELLSHLDGLKNELKRKQKEADNEYINSINDGSRTQVEAFRIRAAKYAEAQRDYDEEIKKVNERRKREHDKELQEINKRNSELLKNMAYWQKKTRDLDQQHLDDTQKTVKSLGDAGRKAANEAIAARRAVIDAYVQLLRETEQPELTTSGLYGKQVRESAELIQERRHLAELMGVPGPETEFEEGPRKRVHLGPGTVSQIGGLLRADAARQLDLAKWKKYTDDLRGIFEVMFDDLLSAPRNFFSDMVDMFKQMLVRMAAEWAASEVIRSIRSAFGGKKGATGAGAGLAAGGALGGTLGTVVGGLGIGLGLAGLFKGLKFQEGGWVPGPIGAPRAAIIHGGEYVVPAGGGHPGGISINGPIHVYGVTDVGSLYRELGRVARQMAPVRMGS